MAAKLNLWDEAYPGGDKQVKECPELETKLSKNATVLVEDLQISQDLWTRLNEKQVFDRKAQDRIMEITSPVSQKFVILAELTAGRVFKVHGFLWALTNTGQFDLVSKMGFDVGDYIDDDIFTRTSAFKCPACLEYYTKSYILTGCQHYVCSPCVKGAQFVCKDGGKEEITCPVPECGKVTTTKHIEDAQIGLDEDEPFTTLTNIVKGALERQRTCEVCEKKVQRCENEHMCMTCEKVLCMMCYITHSDTHTHTHKHMKNKCCYHGYPVLKVCDTCDTYYCKICESPKCISHKLNDYKDTAEAKHEETSTKLNKCQIKGSEIEAETKKAKTLLASLEGKFKERIKKEEECFKKHIKRWAEESLEEWSRVNCEVVTKNANILKWVKVTRDLNILISAQPWRFTNTEDINRALDEFPEHMKEETQEYVSKIKEDGTLQDEKRFLSYFQEQKQDLEENCARSSRHTYIWQIQGISALKQPKTSEVFIRQNCPWYLKVKPRNSKEGQGENLAVYVFLHKMEGVETELNSCTADADLRLLTWDSTKGPYLYSLEMYRYVAGGSGWGSGRLISMKALLNTDNGYVKDGKIRIEVNIRSAVPEYKKRDEEK